MAAEQFASEEGFQVILVVHVKTVASRFSLFGHFQVLIDAKLSGDQIDQIVVAEFGCWRVL